MRFEFGKKLSSACPHSGYSGTSQIFDSFSYRRIARGKIGEPLHGERLHDGTCVGETSLQGRDGAPALGTVWLQARNHGSQVPPQFLFGCFRQQSEQLVFIRLKKRHVFACFFSRISGSHADRRVGRGPKGTLSGTGIERDAGIPAQQLHWRFQSIAGRGRSEERESFPAAHFGLQALESIM